MVEYLIIGTGRSGTGFMSKLLTNNGISCGHETLFGLQNVKDFGMLLKTTTLKADSSWLSVPHIKEINKDIKYIHIIRNPIDVIKSFIELNLFCDESSPYIKFIGKYCDLNYNQPIDKVISYYVKWFKMIESNDINKLSINLENIDYEKLSIFVGKELIELEEKVNTKTDSKIFLANREEIHNRIKKSSLYNELKELSKRYGYEI